MLSEDLKKLSLKYHGYEGVILDMLVDMIKAWEDYKYFNDISWKVVEKKIEELELLLRD